MAVAALVITGVLLVLHPSTAFGLGNATSLASQSFPIESCYSPFNRLTGDSTPSFDVPGIPAAALKAMEAQCSGPTNGREHIVDALGIGAVILIGLSFLPRRRPVMTVPVNPAML
jgi:hypothetical protein